MKESSTNLYELFSKYNAEKEGDIDTIEARGQRMKYLKWMRGWQEVLKVDPTAEYQVLPSADGNILWHIGTGGMVHVSVTILGQTKTEWYPIESSPMKSVPWDAITPSQVNKAIKRAMVKCLALFGLAANLYLNDDLTEGEKDEITVDITSLLSSAKTIQDLTTIYNAHAQLIQKTPKLLMMFTARKNEITTTTPKK